jgi:hypothetical protein
VWGVGSNPGDGSVQSIQTIVHTSCPLLPCGYQEGAAGGINLQCGGSQEARSGRRQSGRQQSGSRSKKPEVVMKKPQEARATPRPEHLLCSSNSTTYHLPMISTSVVLSEIHQTLK